jgi:hypothetical protein
LLAGSGAVLVAGCFLNPKTDDLPGDRAGPFLPGIPGAGDPQAPGDNAEVPPTLGGVTGDDDRSSGNDGDPPSGPLPAGEGDAGAPDVFAADAGSDAG